MKIYGYAKKVELEETLLEMGEISICATAKQLRLIGDFLHKMADEVNNEQFEHEHLKYYIKEFKNTKTDIIIVSTKYIK
jgi:hypothetical protein